MIISISGQPGLKTAKDLLENNRIMLEERFAPFFIRQLEQIQVGTILKTSHIYEIGEGGIYRTLWNVGESMGCGLEVDERKIPIRQEVLEILEIFNESPYETPSPGCYIILSDDIVAGTTIIGRTTKNKARKVVEKDFERFLTPPERQKRDILDRKSYCS